MKLIVPRKGSTNVLNTYAEKGSVSKDFLSSFSLFFGLTPRLGLKS